MSGRSAYVRKEKTKVKDGTSTSVQEREQKSQNPILEAFPMPNGAGVSDFGHERHIKREARSAASSLHSDETAYARVRKPIVPVLDVSGIEKSSFRALMDKKSEGVRKGLAAITFGKKKKIAVEVPESRPHTAATIRPRMSSPEFNSVPFKERTTRRRGSDDGSQFGPPSGPPSGLLSGPQSGPPYGKLPPVPPAPQLRRWAGAGRSPHNWNKLRKDPELWDPQGDTLVFLCRNVHQSSRLPPSFRLCSHVLETTRSRFFTTILREGYVDLNSDVESPSSASSAGPGPAFWNGREDKYTHSQSGSARQDPDGQISYEIFFPSPPNQSKSDTLRWHTTTRNVFALLYGASIVGLDLYQALKDLQNRLHVYLPPDAEIADRIINYLTAKGIDDVRNDPETALSLLRWSEEKPVYWQEGWREAFVHCVGMYNRAKELPNLRLVSPITGALLERASLESQVRVESAQDRLVRFKFQDMWPAVTTFPPPERASFERLRMFLVGFYEAQVGLWPPQSATDDGQWLTRDLAKRLQTDFGALYDYLANRDVGWDCAEERSGRKWNMVSSNPSRPVEPDTPEMPLTDILIAFDNLNRFPHIPHPYPLVPASVPIVPKDIQKATKKANKSAPLKDKATERRVALAYAEATNIYSLGADFVSNRLVDGYVQFEKVDRLSEVDPAAARRGRWVLIYGILQVLASVSVDTPSLRYKDNVTYHLHPRLRGTPPWKGADTNYEEASHEASYCWLAPKMWAMPAEAEVPMLDSVSVSSLAKPPRKQSAASSSPSLRYSTAETESDTASSSVRSAPSTARSSRTRWPSHRLPAPKEPDLPFGPLLLPNSYGPGIEKVEQWPILKEDSVAAGGDLDTARRVAIKDFDDYQF